MTEHPTIAAGPAPEDAAAAPRAAAPPAPEAAAPPAPETQPVPESGAEVLAPAALPEDRRKLFAFLRWTAAFLVFGAAGTGAAYGISQPERTDIPGLSTESDGRWTYPELAKPALPPGAALPFAPDNEDGIHYAGLTQLLLPAPLGSTPDPALKVEKDGVVAVDTFLEEYGASGRAKMKQEFADDGLRQIVGRGWTTPDGIRTRLYLLRFHASGFTDAFDGCGPDMSLSGVNRIETDGVWGKARIDQSVPDGTGLSVHEESIPVGDEKVRIGCIQSGDVQAVILQSRKGEVLPAVPLHQMVVLQHQLLS
ncbi:hypothetical protein [Streptomyces antarcticus]|uniref:hypothetical protein n=1 Tax=Streptomyces antarcticus TaxID=2996458 RepID=UPI00226D6D73|nr:MULTISPECIES: hypothetical protein [unclassified Streptomyces]MCY0945996.1 hypothetical protein [Streptomyces sp. H34-AA3]MCZ4084804.1 hypothetical protein [Streptomyces sp. H34-S5]